MTLIETMEKIKSLRFEANQALVRDSYDPCGHTAQYAKELRDEADALEREMEVRLGWREPSPVEPVEPVPPSEGWVHPAHERKAHYYVKGRSLCRRKIYLGPMEDARPSGEAPGEADCKTCWAKREKFLTSV